MVSTVSSTDINQNTIETPYDGSSQMLSMTTFNASTVKLGDHVELRLKNSNGNTVLSNYA